MTTQTLATNRSLLSTIGSAIFNAYETFARRSPAAKCAEEAERLFALSDEELARRGLLRSGILQHAFRHYVHY